MIYWLLLIVSVSTAIPIVVVFVEVCAALVVRRPSIGGAEIRPRIDVLIPAHDEEVVITQTLASVREQLRAGDRIVVVADNCSDRTADIAKQTGVTVFERFNDEHRGKGFALAFGREKMSPDCGDVVVIIDADCRLEAGTLDALADAAMVTGRPVQADYVMTCPPDPSPRDIVSQLAVTVKNRVRQKGTATLGGSAVLTGSGMAFTWDVFRRAQVDGGNIVEDMQLSFDLLLAGYAPLYCSKACVVAPLPKQRHASLAQRTRWEHGHLQTLLRRVPRLIVEAVRQRRLILLGAAIDLAVPPLSLLVLLWGVVFAVSATVAALGYGTAPWWTSVVAGTLLLAAMIMSILRFGGGISPWTVVSSVPRYIAGKIPIYFAFLFRRQIEWVRTDRDGATFRS